MKKFLYPLLITLLLVFSIGIRIWRIDKAPSSVNWDEAALGYNAYSIYMTGRDEFGKAFPVSLRSFDDYKPSLYAYLSVPVIAISGLSEFSTRLVSVVSGMLLVFMVLYITAKTTGSMIAGLIAGLFTAVSPWAIHFSRIAFETNLGSELYYTGIALFLLSLKRSRAFIYSLIFMILSMYAYHAQRAIALPTLLVLSIIFGKQIKLILKRFWFRYLFICILILIPLFISFLTEPAASRLASTNILKLWPFTPNNFSLFIYNPVYSFVMLVCGQFLTYFSPINIFLKGSVEPILRIPTLGLLPIELFPLWVIGLLTMKNYKLFFRIVLIILLLTPLPGVVTWNWFSVVRTISLYPAFGMISAIGGIELFKLIKKVKLFAVLLFSIIFLLSSLYTILTIAIYAPYETYGEFQPGFKEMVPYVMKEAMKYQKVVIDSGQTAPYIFFLFYSHYSPALYQKENMIATTNGGTEKRSFGKFEVRDITRADLDIKDILYVGPVKVLPDWAVTNIFQKKGAIVKDFIDIFGYTSYRVVSL